MAVRLISSKKSAQGDTDKIKNRAAMLESVFPAQVVDITGMFLFYNGPMTYYYRENTQLEFEPDLLLQQ